jgi:hypothetical protein
MRLGHRNSRPIISGSLIQRSSESQVVSVISKRTGLPVFLWIIEVRSLTHPAAKTSRTRSPTRSQPRSLLSTAMLNSARSRLLPANSRRTLMDQTCRSRSGRFWPMIRPLFQGTRAGRRAGRRSTDVGLPPVHRTHPSSVLPTPAEYHDLLCVVRALGGKLPFAGATVWLRHPTGADLRSSPSDFARRSSRRGLLTDAFAATHPQDRAIFAACSFNASGNADTPLRLCTNRQTDCLLVRLWFGGGIAQFIWGADAPANSPSTQSRKEPRHMARP